MPLFHILHLYKYLFFGRARNAENGTGSRWSAFLEPVDGSEKLTPDPELWAREYDTEDNFIGSFHPRQRNQNQSHKTTKKIHRGGGLGEADGGSEEADDHNAGWQEYERNEEKIISRLFEDDNTKLECSSSKPKRVGYASIFFHLALICALFSFVFFVALYFLFLFSWLKVYF